MGVTLRENTVRVQQSIALQTKLQGNGAQLRECAFAHGYASPGLRRSKHLGHPTSSPSSSASGSPSSSISAPIRWQADENGAWGPLGRRLSAYAHANGRPKRSVGLQRGWVGQQPQQPQARMKMDVSERTPLIKSGRNTVAYVDAGLDGGASADDERAVDGEDADSEDEEAHGDIAMRAAALRREEDAVFGKWPWRLFNRHVCHALYLI